MATNSSFIGLHQRSFNMTEHFKHIADWVAAGVGIATLLKVLPALAALMTIVWTGVRLYDRFKGKKFGDE